VEAGFISNPTDERQLTRSDHQDQLARAIVNGVSDHFQSSPPPGSLIAHRQRGGDGGRRYEIRRGDTLSSIARRTQTSVTRIKEINDLNTESLKIGQVISIPSS